MPCLVCGTPTGGKPRCPSHLRGTTTQRGYGRDHRRLRARWAQRILSGEDVRCWRCRTPIRPGDDWHLGHDDHDRTLYRGPECEACNCATNRIGPPGVGRDGSKARLPVTRQQEKDARGSGGLTGSGAA
jgi:hypothetical protein